MVNTIIFDLGNVIVNFDETPIFNAWAKASNKTAPCIKKYYRNSAARISFEVGKLSARQFYEITVKELNMKMGFEKFKKIWCGIFTLNKYVEKIIRNLKGKYRLILLSNTNILQYEYVKKKYKIVDIFDEHVLSYKVGCRKPSPLIFMKAVRKAKTFPFNCAYFDDIPEFIYVARMLGIKAFQFKTVEKLKKDLISLKVI